MELSEAARANLRGVDRIEFGRSWISVSAPGLAMCKAGRHALRMSYPRHDFWRP
jgi:hypothetical protein